MWEIQMKRAILKCFIILAGLGAPLAFAQPPSAAISRAETPLPAAREPTDDELGEATRQPPRMVPSFAPAISSRSRLLHKCLTISRVSSRRASLSNRCSFPIRIETRIGSVFRDGSCGPDGSNNRLIRRVVAPRAFLNLLSANAHPCLREVSYFGVAVAAVPVRD